MTRTRRPDIRGIIALTTLMISTILLILIVALLTSLKDDKYAALEMNSRAEIEYVAEAGIAYATLQLSKNNNWKPTSLTPHELPDGSGSFTIAFDIDGGPVGPNYSVNNLAYTTKADGPRGSSTVPGRTADVVVLAEVDGRQERYEVLISRGFSEPLGVPLLASGDITLEGPVNVQGTQTTTNPSGTPSGIHSNSREDKAGIVNWTGTGDDEAYINGEVSVSSTNPGAIGASSNFFPDSVNHSAGSKQFPLVDVDLAVLAGGTVPNLVVNPGGTTVVSGGDRKFVGGVINGDLELDGVNLFVKGDLEVNGTIKGTGAIYVKGNTSFKGTAQLGGTNSDVLALFSKGHVSLTGFRGSQYLQERAAADPLFADWHEQAGWAHKQLEEIISATSGYTSAVGLPVVPDVFVDEATTDAPDVTWGNDDGNVVDLLRVVLGEDNDLAAYPGTESNTLEKMADYLDSNYPANPSDPTVNASAQYMVGRLRKAREFYQNKNDAPVPANIISDFNSSPSNRLGALDAINDGFNATAATKSNSAMADLTFKELGKSYFRGIVYTTGGVYAANEVEIVGALLSEKRGDSPADITINGTNVTAGSVYMEGGTTLVYHEELLKDPFSGSTFGPMVVSAWLGN